LTRIFGVDSNRKTPAYEFDDGLDYVPTKQALLFGHHFSSIAGAGPLGPVLAVYLDWGPAVLWILIGCVFIGAMHDFAALFISVRNERCSIGYVVEQYLGYSNRQIFLLLYKAQPLSQAFARGLAGITTKLGIPFELGILHLAVMEIKSGRFSGHQISYLHRSHYWLSLFISSGKNIKVFKN